MGREVKRFFEGSMYGTSKQIVWDGRNRACELMSSGVYIYHLKVGETVKVQQMVLIR